MAKIIQGQLSAKGKKFGIVVSRFNEFITSRLLEGALDCIQRYGEDPWCRVNGDCDNL